MSSSSDPFAAFVARLEEQTKQIVNANTRSAAVEITALKNGIATLTARVLQTESDCRARLAEQASYMQTMQQSVLSMQQGMLALQQASIESEKRLLASQQETQRALQRVSELLKSQVQREDEQLSVAIANM